MDVWLLKEGFYWENSGEIVAIFKLKRDVIDWIRLYKPGFKRRKKQEETGELYFENDQERLWLLCNTKMRIYENNRTEH